MTIHFSLTKLVVADLERCAAFHASAFGLTEQYRVHSEIAGRPIDALCARAIAAGATVAQAVADAPEHGVRVGFLADPEGRLIEVVEPR
jgi:predicted enzyme related to lactoylglutathione lyase